MPYAAQEHGDDWSTVIFTGSECIACKQRKRGEFCSGPSVEAFASLLFTKGIAPSQMVYNFLFWETLEINFPSANVKSEKLWRCNQPKADGDSRVNTVIPLISG